MVTNKQDDLSATTSLNALTVETYSKFNSKSLFHGLTYPCMCCHPDSFYTCPTLPALAYIVTLITSGRSLRSLQCWALLFDLAGEAEMLLQADSLILLCCNKHKRHSSRERTAITGRCETSPGKGNSRLPLLSRPVAIMQRT